MGQKAGKIRFFRHKL